MKELDKLVENYFIEKKAPELGMDMLLEMVEQSLEEAIYYQNPETGKLEGPYEDLEVVRNEIIDHLKNEFPDISVEYKDGQKVIQLTNFGDRVSRDMVLKSLEEKGHAWFSGEETQDGFQLRAKTNYVDLDEEGNPVKQNPVVVIDLKQGKREKQLYNKGNFMEGVVAYALAARFEAGEATEDNVKDFAKKHENESKQTSQGARSIREYKEGDLEVKIGLDNITFEELDDPNKWQYADIASAVALANSNYYSEYLEKVENLFIDADGIGDQSTTVVDITVSGKDADGEEHIFLNSGFSLKSLSKQLWQTGRNILEVRDMFKNLLGVDLQLPGSTEEEAMEMFKRARPPYTELKQYFRKEFGRIVKQYKITSDNNENRFLENFFKKLPKYAVKAEEGQTVPPLVSLGSPMGDFNIYDFSKQLELKSDELAESYDVSFRLLEPKKENGPHRLGLFFGDDGVLAFRPKYETAGFRFYIDQGNTQKIKDLFGIKQEETP
jgi:hypothetical protein